MSGIFLAVDRCHMPRIPIKIWSPDPKLLPVYINPFPEVFTGTISLVPCLAVDTHDIGRKPVAVAAARAPTMVRPICRRFQAACERLTVVITERAGYARRQPGFLRRVRILPGEILIDELGKTPGDSYRFAFLLDLHFPLLIHLDGVLLGRPLIERPQVLVDANVRFPALVGKFDGTDRTLGVIGQ